MTGRGIHGQSQEELDACPSPRPFPPCPKVATAVAAGQSSVPEGGPGQSSQPPSAITP